MSKFVMQGSLFGPPVVSGNVVDKMTYILETYPEARASYRTAVGRYWAEFDGLEAILGDKTNTFLDWLERHATSFKTLQNRCQDVQNDRPDLDAPPEIERARQAQSRAGPIK